MKKILLGLGAIVAVVTPVVALVSCGETTRNISIDITKAKTPAEVSTKLSGLTDDFKLMGSSKVDCVVFAIKDGDRNLMWNVRKADGQKKLSDFFSNLVEFLKSSYSQRGEDGWAGLGDIGDVFSGKQL